MESGEQWNSLGFTPRSNQFVQLRWSHRLLCILQIASAIISHLLYDLAHLHFCSRPLNFFHSSVCVCQWDHFYPLDKG